MRAICANPTSPLGETDFFRNQTGKLGKLEQGRATGAERTTRAKMSDYRDAMRAVSDKLGSEFLKLREP